MAQFAPFDSLVLERRLSALPRGAQGVFAAACANRVANCRAQLDDPGDQKPLDETKRLLRNWWDVALGVSGDLRALADRTMRLAEGGEESGSPIVADAAAAANCACMCLLGTDSAQQASLAAECVVNTIDSFLNQNEFAEFEYDEVDGQGLIVGHALMQTELARQHRDLDLLEKGQSDPQKAAEAVWKASEGETALS